MSEFTQNPSPTVYLRDTSQTVCSCQMALYVHTLLPSEVLLIPSIIQTNTYPHIYIPIHMSFSCFIFKGLQDHGKEGMTRRVPTPERSIEVLIQLPINQIAFVSHHHFQKHTNPFCVQSLY